MPSHMLSGFYAALLSGFSDDGAFDEGRQRALCDHVLRQDIDGLYVSGTTAEQALMQVAERVRQIALVGECAREHGARLIAHVGAPALRDAETLAHVARQAGFDAVSSLPPAPEHAGGLPAVVDYYKAIIQAAGLPLFVYLYPAPGRRAFDFDDAAALLSIPGVAGIKFTSGDLYLFSRLRRAFPDSTLFYGFDEIFACGVLLGADGGIGSTYNMVGGLYRRIYDRVQAGDIAEARRLQALSAEFVTLLLAANLLPAIKHLLARRGVDCGPCRNPLALAESDRVKALEAFVDSGVLDEFLV